MQALWVQRVALRVAVPTGPFLLGVAVQMSTTCKVLRVEVLEFSDYSARFLPSAGAFYFCLKFRVCRHRSGCATPYFRVVGKALGFSKPFG